MTEKDPNEFLQKPQDKIGTRHYQVLLVSLSLMIADAINYSLPIAIIPMTDKSSTRFIHFDWSTSETSMILSSFIWGYAIFQIPSSYLANKWSAQKLFSLGLFVSSIINMFLPILSHWGGWMALCAGRVIQGICQSSFSSCTLILLSKWAPTTERSRMSSFASTGSVLGAIIATSVSGVIADSSLGWPAIFYFFGGVSLMLSIVFYFYVWDCPTQHKTICPVEKDFIVNNLRQIKNHCQVDSKNVRTPWKKILTSVPVWALIIVESGSCWGKWTMSTELPSYMKNILNYNIAENGIVSTMPHVTNWLLSFVFSWASDYATRKNVSASRIRRACNTVGMWGPALALVALCFPSPTSNIRLYSVGLLILAIGLKAGISSGYIVNCIDLTPNYAGTIYSFTTCVSSFVCMLAPIACGAIVTDPTNVQQWHIVFYTTAAIYFVTNLIYVIFGRGKTRSWNNPKTVSVSTIYDPSSTDSIA